MATAVKPESIPSRCLGETGALNFKPPTEQDLKDSAALEDTLIKMKIFETPEEVHQRRLALIKLQEVCNKWIYLKALEQNLPEHIASETTGKVFTFGSYRLGVNFIGADIDALLVVPRFITREEFFSEFQNVLGEEPSVEDLQAVPDAFVPVLKMKLMGVEIDLLFAKVDVMSVRSDFNLSENTEQLLRNMDERDVRSVNGVRVTEDILNLVYSKEVFKTSLKAIRLWAKRKNIYSNAIGFLGGVSWAILTARICQLYPMACPPTIIHSFFTVYSIWPWPKPVSLRPSEYIPTLNLPVWDSRINPNDQYHLMPILTPSYPSQNSTYNVQHSNKDIIKREFDQGLEVVKDILLKKRPWSDLFEPAFFFTYRHYMVVVVSGSQKRAFKERCGLVESRLRILVASAENNRYVKLAHVNSHAFGKGPNDGDVEFVKKWFIGLEFETNHASSTSVSHTTPANDSLSNAKLNVDLSDVIMAFETAINRGQPVDATNTTDVAIRYVKKTQLSKFLCADDMDTIKRDAAAHNAFKRSMPRSGSNLSTFSTDSPRNGDSPGPAVNSPQAAESTTATSPSTATQTSGLSDKTEVKSSYNGKRKPISPSHPSSNGDAGISAGEDESSFQSKRNRLESVDAMNGDEHAKNQPSAGAT